MVEQVYNMTYADTKIAEILIADENLNYIHVILNKGDGFPEHFSNANVYMTVIRGTLSIGLDEQETHEYKQGSVLKIPFHTKMNINNKHDEILELIIVKAPAPAK